MTKKVLFAILAATLVAILVPMGVAQDLHATKRQGDITIPSQQLNTLIALEATQNEINYFTSQFGTPMSGKWHGTVTDTGWNLTFRGSINDQVTRITETGSRAANTATWTDTGTVGAISVGGNGPATLSGSTMDWRQAMVAGEDGPEEDVDAVQFIGCEAFPPSCPYLIAGSILYLLHGALAINDVATQLDATTGIVFGSSIQVSSLLTTTQEGSITFADGKISYAARVLHHSVLGVPGSRQSSGR